MGIQELPQNTVRALGANQALTDPASLVKELVDNALDANANSISVEISNNTLDVIQVRDNGHGIAPLDRELVARRYCTSKISRHADLKDIGGSSLGFRGEALASAAELSGGLIITTRVEGEQVATALKISQQGEVSGQDRASSPIGTTIKVTDFIKANPVRKQVALKNTEACLKKIKRLLQAYAFARPHVRLSLRVLKAKNNKGDWIYAPKPSGNAEDVAFKVVGSACTSQCMWSILEERGFTLQAFLPRPNADLTKVCNTGTFLSIDARPVSTTRGLLKQMSKVFRESLKSLHPIHGEIREPFLYLEISCPQGAYDANIEPAKDDVLFEDADVVLEMVKQLFRTVYEPAACISALVNDLAAPRSEVLPQIEELNDLATDFADDFPAATPPVTRTADGSRVIDTGNVPQQIGEGDDADSENIAAEAAERRNFRSTMYGCDKEDVELYQDAPLADSTEADLEELRQARKDKTLSNPWTLAKLNTSIRRAEADADSPVESALSASPTRRELPLGLPTPRPSSPSKPEECFHPSDHVPQMRFARDGRAIDDSSTLTSPQIYMPASMPAFPGREDRLASLQRDITPSICERSSQAAGEPFPTGTPLNAIPQAAARSGRSPTKRPQARVNRPFVPPTMEQPEREKVWFDIGETTNRRGQGAGWGRRTQVSNDTGNLVAQGELEESIEDSRTSTPPRRNRDIRDFVDRALNSNAGSSIERCNFSRPNAANKSTNQHPDEELFTPPIRRDFMPASEPEFLNGHPDIQDEPDLPASKRRKTVDRQALQELSTNIDLTNSVIDNNNDHRPTTSTRALSRRRSSRTKSSRLPLERTPAGKRAHDLAITVMTDTTKLAQLARRLDEHRSLLNYEDAAVVLDGNGFVELSGDMDAIASRLDHLLLAAGPQADVEDIETINARRDALRTELQSAYSRFMEDVVESV
jgi:DNA mismatch repair protein MutL